MALGVWRYVREPVLTIILNFDTWFGIPSLCMNGLLKTSDNFLIHSYFLTSSSHACCFCLFSDNKWPIFVERQILFLIIKLCAVKMLLQARFEPATYGFQHWPTTVLRTTNWAIEGCSMLTRYPCSIVAHCLCESPSWSLSHTEIADRGNGPSDKKTTAILFVWERLVVLIFAAHYVKVIQCQSIEGRPTDGFGCLTVCKRASSHNYFEFWYLVWHTISLYEWPFENIWQIPHPFIFSHLIITCLLFLFVFLE